MQRLTIKSPKNGVIRRVDITEDNRGESVTLIPALLDLIKDQADHINAQAGTIAGLEAEIRRMKETPKMVSITEKLPETYRDESTGTPIPFLVCKCEMSYPIKAFFNGECWTDGMFELDVTHWMPFPTPANKV